MSNSLGMEADSPDNQAAMAASPKVKKSKKESSKKESGQVEVEKKKKKRKAAIISLSCVEVCAAFASFAARALMRTRL